LAQQKQEDFRIRINPEYEAIWQEFKSDEVYERLSQNIKKLGQLHPIIVNQHGIILDGHSRYHIFFMH
jgi:ParB-like chromosome segregation protein Spo0J